MDIATALLFNLVIGVAAFMSSLTGFGYALVATPFLVFLFPPQLVVPVVLVSWVPLAGLLVREAKGQMQPRRIGRWVLGGVFGVPLGGYGLASVDEGAMRAAIGGITLIAALTLWFKPSRPLQKERLAAAVVGFVSGMMGGATGMSGPPVILFGLNQGWDHRELRANLIGYFVIIHSLALVFLQEFGILNRETLLLGVAALPGLMLGYAGGMYLKEKVSQKHFRSLAFALVCIGGLLALVKNG
jgi:uncharacterized protein